MAEEIRKQILDEVRQRADSEYDEAYDKALRLYNIFANMNPEKYPKPGYQTDYDKFPIEIRDESIADFTSEYTLIESILHTFDYGIYRNNMFWIYTLFRKRDLSYGIRWILHLEHPS